MVEGEFCEAAKGTERLLRCRPFVARRKSGIAPELYNIIPIFLINLDIRLLEPLIILRYLKICGGSF